jgi:hypothetical protein
MTTTAGAKHGRSHLTHTQKIASNAYKSTVISMWRGGRRGVVRLAGVVCRRLHLHHAGGRNHHLALRSTRRRADSFDRFHNVHAFDYLSKHDMLAIEPRSDCRSDEELSPVLSIRIPMRASPATNVPEIRSCCDRRWPWRVNQAYRASVRSSHL